MERSRLRLSENTLKKGEKTEEGDKPNKYYPKPGEEHKNQPNYSPDPDKEKGKGDYREVRENTESNLKEKNFVKLFEGFWLGGPYESGNTFINHTLEFYTPLSKEDRELFKKVVKDYSISHQIFNTSLIQGLLKKFI